MDIRDWFPIVQPPPHDEGALLTVKRRVSVI